ncbi:class I tRNA ligase family protein, partial [uncultured Duncaniella sp.]
LASVEDGVIKFVPEKFKTTYRRWLTDIRDWCISRQLWWGHRVPAYYLPDGSFIVAETAEEALKLAQEQTPGLTAADLHQDEDCLDTWFSSWLWPISLFNGILDPDNEEIKYYYPTSDLVTGPDIIFFWVARMIMAGYEYMGKQPFNNVYFTGIVRDEIGRKMSKQLGNSPDPLELIADYGADGVRMGIMLSAPAGNDIFFDKKLCENGRNFCNKVWNAFRLVKGWEIDDNIAQPSSSDTAIKWFESMLSKSIAEINDLFDKFRISEALMSVYRLFRDEFSSWYLEMVKPEYQKPIDRATYNATIGFFDSLLRMLHPFMPFITEELWQHIGNRAEGESIMYASMPAAGETDNELLAAIERAKEIVNGVRGVRAQRNIPNRELLTLLAINENIELADVISKLALLDKVGSTAEKDPAAASFLVGTTEFNIPLLNNIDVEAEKAKIAKEIEYYEGFKKSVEKKLSNERFVSNAPAAVVEGERKKLADADTKLATLRTTLAALS